jgi:hypothetical protein
MITADFPESAGDTIKCFGHYRSSCYIRKLVYKPRIVHAVRRVNAVHGACVSGLSTDKFTFTRRSR